MAKKLTARKIEKYLKNGWSKCPSCKSVSIEGESVQIDGNAAVQEMRCAECGLEWADTYVLSNAAQILR